MDINPKWQKIVDLYIQGWKLRDAAIEAGYSAKTADSQASQILKYPKVQAYMQKIQQEAMKGSVATVREIAEFHTKAFRNDPRSFRLTFVPSSDGSGPQEHNGVKGTWQIETEEGGFPEAIEGIKFDREGRPVEIKFVPKAKAAEDLGKHLGYFDKNNEQRKPSVVVSINEPKKLPDSDTIE